MNVLKNRSIFLMTLVITMCLTLAFTATNVNASKTENNYNGVVIPENVKTLKDAKEKSSIAKSSTKFIKSSFAVKRSEISLEGKVNYNNKMYTVSLNGLIYPIGKGPEGDRELYGDLTVDKGSNDFNFLQLQILKKPTSNEVIGVQQFKNNKSLVNILLEHKKTKEVVVFQMDIKDDLFNSISKAAMNNASDLNDQELNKKISELLKAPATKRESIQDPETSAVDSGSSDQFSTLATDIDYVDRSELRRLKRDLVDAGYYTWLDFSEYDLPKSLFTTEGNMTNVQGSSRLYANGWEDSYGTYIVGISTLNELDDSVGDQIRLQLNMTFSLTVLYDPDTNTIKLRIKDRGMKIDNMKLAMGKLKDDNIFNMQGINGKLMESGDVTSSALKILFSKIPYLKEVSSVWYDLQGALPSSTLELGNEQFYPSSIKEQREQYEDELLRNISSESGDLYMENSDHFYNLVGDVTDEDDDGFTWYWSWKLTYSPNF